MDSSSSEEGSGDTSDSSGSGKGSSSDDEAAPSSAGTKTADLSAQGRASVAVLSGVGGHLLMCIQNLPETLLLLSG